MGHEQRAATSSTVTDQRRKTGVLVTRDVRYLTSAPILVFIGLSVLGPMYATYIRQHHCLMPAYRGGA